jgi:hypothetical protein
VYCGVIAPPDRSGKFPNLAETLLNPSRHALDCLSDQRQLLIDLIGPDAEHRSVTKVIWNDMVEVLFRIND